MELGFVVQVVQLLAGLTVIGGAVFAVVQVRELKRQRQGAVAFTFIQQWNSERSDDLDVVYALPDAADPRQIDGDAAIRHAANSVYMNLEQLGLLVHDEFIDLATADEWAGGAVRVSWRKLRPWIEAKRDRAKSQRPGEWFQWLAERMAERRTRDETVGAHTAYRNWGR